MALNYTEEFILRFRAALEIAGGIDAADPTTVHGLMRVESVSVSKVDELMQSYRIVINQVRAREAAMNSGGLLPPVPPPVATAPPPAAPVPPAVVIAPPPAAVQFTFCGEAIAPFREPADQVRDQGVSGVIDLELDLDLTLGRP